ncbi:MAG: DUF4040 domain-containing protein, partial [Thioalkalivibrio sp.]|nr:DUF4040 domain-containing protein [Thioalkalivibrio sp.]
VKAGVFLLARLWPVLAGTEAWFYLVATTGLVTMVAGAVIALFKDDLKALLAYSTVSHLGLMTMLFGFGTPMAAVAGVFHIINHATFKAALFMNAGIVDHESGTRDIKRLGGLMFLMPITATLAMVAAASMAGLAPLNGFLSKEMMLEAAHTVWAGNIWAVPLLATLGAVFSVAYAFRFIVHVFFGPKRQDYPIAKPHDPPVGLWLPPALLAYSTVSHLGLMTMLFGFGTPMAAVAGVFHIINHATFKAALFMNAGIVDHETGTRDIKRLGGLMFLMPITATLAMVAAASMAGLPLLNGFLSKEMMLEEASHTVWAGNIWAVPLLATLGAVFSVAYAFRFIVHVFFGPKRQDYPSARPHDPPAGLWLPPALLVALVVLIGLFPETFAGTLVRVTAGAVIGGPTPDFHLSLWHGVTPALVLSIVATLGGLLLLWRYRNLRALWQAGPHPEAKAMFDAVVGFAVRGSRVVVHGLHNGSLQRYLTFLVGAGVVMGFVAFMGAEHQPGTRDTLPANAAVLVGWLLLLGAAAAGVVLHRQRFLAVIVTGVLGLMVSVGFVFLSAPDLALTQISVDVVTVILILLALYFIPKVSPVESGAGRRIRDGALAVVAGVGIGALSWAVMTRDFTSLSGFYLEQAKPGGGGTNVVNVILVDFRGFDTFGEIIVLGIAALAIFALLDGALRGGPASRLARWSPDMPQAADRHPLIMVVATRVMLPLVLMVGAYIFLRGHNLPGGGFIAGLVVSIGFIMQYMASGFAWAEKQMHVGYDAMIGAGVLIAAVTGIAPMLLGYPFLTSAFGYFTLPVVGQFELASAMLFDAGVFLAVLGAVMLALANLSRMGCRVATLPVNLMPMDGQPDARNAAERGSC